MAFPTGRELQQFDYYARRRPADLGIEHVGRQAPVHLEAVGSFNALIEPQRGDAEDFDQRCLHLGGHVVT